MQVAQRNSARLRMEKKLKPYGISPLEMLDFEKESFEDYWHRYWDLAWRIYNEKDKPLGGILLDEKGDFNEQ